MLGTALGLALGAASAVGSPPMAEAGHGPLAALVPQAASHPTVQEMALLAQLAQHPSWVRRMVAAMRYERWGRGGLAATELVPLLADPDARVRGAAVLALARAGAPLPPERAAAETHPRVQRTMLRCGYRLDSAMVDGRARALMKASTEDERLLGVELAAALAVQGQGSRALDALARDTFRSIVARLDREAAGALSPRLAALTGAPDYRVDFKWRLWLNRITPSRSVLRGGRLIGGDADPSFTAVARLSSDDFVQFAQDLEAAFTKPIDLALALDCTASMSSELAAAQAGVSDLMDFAAAATGGMRVAVVGYRDRGDDWKIKSSDFTGSRQQAQSNLWQLRADGGGDEPELVHEALRTAYTQFNWRAGDRVQRVLVLVGDAPPHPGFGGTAISLSRQARKAGIVTFVVSTRHEDEPDEVKHFPEIAAAGGGRVVRLASQKDLAAELAGVVVADTWHDPMVALFERFLLIAR